MEVSVCIDEFYRFLRDEGLLDAYINEFDASFSKEEDFADLYFINSAFEWDRSNIVKWSDADLQWIELCRSRAGTKERRNSSFDFNLNLKVSKFRLLEELIARAAEDALFNGKDQA